MHTIGTNTANMSRYVNHIIILDILVPIYVITRVKNNNAIVLTHVLIISLLLLNIKAITYNVTVIYIY